MPTYRFTAYNEMGRKVTGEAEAKNESELDDQLKRVGLDLLRFDEEAYKKPIFFRRPKYEDMITLCIQMHHLTRAGLSMLETIDSVQKALGPGLLRTTLVGVYHRIEKGDTLREAFACFPSVFNRFFLGMVGAGESTGKLPAIFLELEHYFKWIAELRRRFIKAVRYPLVSMSFTSGLVFLWIAYLLHFALYGSFTLPPDWLRYIPVPGFLLHGWPFIIGLPPLLTFTIVRLYRRSEEFAFGVDRVLMRIPYLSALILRLNMARFSRVFTMLYNAGIDITDSLSGGAAVITNRVVRESIITIQEHLRRGMTLSDAVRLTGHIPPLVAQSLQTGEKTGNMGEALDAVNHFYTIQVNDAVDNLIGLLRPAFMVLSGVLLCGGASTPLTAATPVPVD